MANAAKADINRKLALTGAKPDVLQKALDWHSEAITADAAWQARAESDAAFKAGDQWTDQERWVAEHIEGRNLLTFNFTKPLVDLVIGLIIQNRIRVYADPTEENDQFLCDMLNDVCDFVDERTDAMSEELEAADDAFTTGRGFVALDVAPDPKRPTEIKIIETNVPVYEIRVDPRSRRADLKDSRFIFREKWLNREDFKVDYPEFAKDIDELFDGVDVLTMESATDPEMGEVFKLSEVPDSDDSDYDTPVDLDPRYYDKAKDQVRVMHCEYWVAYDRYYGFNPETGQVEEFKKEDLPKLKKIFPLRYGQEFEYETVKDKKVKWLQFIKHRILYDDDSPLPFDGFSIVPCFGYRDKSKGGIGEYGIVHNVKDTNREINKRYNQMLHLLMSQGKGVMAEKDAFEDWQQAEGSWMQPDKITWVTQGALAGGKIQEKPGVVLSEGLFKLDEANQMKMRTISGINPDLLGSDRGRAEPGVVIQLRQKQGMILLEALLRNFRRMRKEIFKRKLAIIMKYMPDQQIARIIGQKERYMVRGGVVVDKINGFIAPIRNVRDMSYNVKVTAAPENTTKRMMELAQYMEMLKAGFPVDPKTVVSKMELTAGDKKQWIEFIERMEEGQQQAQQAQMQAEMEKIKAEIAVKQQKVQSDHQIGIMGVMQREKEAALEHKAREDDSIRDFQVALAQLDTKGRESLIKMIQSMATGLGRASGTGGAGTGQAAGGR